MPKIARVVAVWMPRHITQRGSYNQVIFEEDGDYRIYTLFILFVVSLFAFFISSEAAEVYESVKIDNGQLHIITTDHREILPLKREFKLGDENIVQVDFEQAVISDDKDTIGWLALYPNCCTSYPIPLELIIFKNGDIVRVFRGNELPIWLWKFQAKGKRVAFKQETVHGGLGIHYELREIRTGRLIDSYEGEHQPDAPKWVRDLEIYYRNK